ncbi:MAG: hypothetical protein VX304_06980 [Planctomycetota bacterium]|nr:hypothetical protein [Planctomycetota bacterium]
MFVMADAGPLDSIVEALGQIIFGLQQIVSSIASVVLTAPVLPVLCWTVFWLFAVDWIRLRQILLKGGWLGVMLVGFVMVIVWQQISPGSQSVLGLELNGYIEKLVYVTALLSVMFVCGAVQLTGCCTRWCAAEVVEVETTDSH